MISNDAIIRNQSTDNITAKISEFTAYNIQNICWMQVWICAIHAWICAIHVQTMDSYFVRAIYGLHSLSVHVLVRLNIYFLNKFFTFFLIRARAWLA